MSLQLSFFLPSIQSLFPSFVNCKHPSLCMFQERGVELLVDLLCESGSPGEVMQGEAAGVVAQLTSPCLQHGHHLAGLLQDLHCLLQALLRECLFVVHPTSAGSN